jgi:hypothetical protein
MEIKLEICDMARTLGEVLGIEDCDLLIARLLESESDLLGSKGAQIGPE